jgi:23S rRNA (pseudouridine1915-N3)-methyltransferase
LIRRCTLVCVGKPKGWAAEASKDYADRLRRYFPVDIVEVAEVDMNRRSHNEVLSSEGENILRRLPKEAYVISLDREKGKQHPSEKLALELEARGAQHAQLGVAVEAVAGLDFDRGSAFGEPDAQAASCRGQ